MGSVPQLTTFGHGRLSADELTGLLVRAGVGRVVDIRRFPGSLANEAAARGRIPQILQQAGIAYVWEERLGGRRRLTKAEDAASPDGWWQVAAFRAYAAWTRGADFRTGLANLASLAGDGTPTAVMCSEAVWWRCHRRLVSDVLVLEAEWEVSHLGHDGKLTPHPTAAGARVGQDGRVVWDRA